MIVAELIKIQKQRHLTNDQMAKSLGIHKVSWLRNKRTGVINGDVVLKAFEVYPELEEDFVASFIGVKPALTFDEKPPKPHCGFLWHKVKVLVSRLFKGVR